MTGWTFEGVELPFGDGDVRRWISSGGVVSDAPIADAEELPGRYFLYGLVDAHSHPAVAVGPSGPVALDAQTAGATLMAWAETGVALIRDVGSPGGITLDLTPQRGWPEILAAGRFLAPEGRYFPELLAEPVGEAELLDAARTELERGATWVKVIGDFARVPGFTDEARTYPLGLIAELCASVHSAGGRVAVHTVLPDAGRLVAVGVDSIEHGTGLDAAAVETMALHGAAWTPTCCAVLGVADDEGAPVQRRNRARDARERFRELLPLAVSLGVPVLAGTDVVGTIAQEVSLLAELGLEPREALAAATEWPRQFLGFDGARADVVGYAHDPREDPAQLADPVAVVIDGTRRR